MVIGLVGVTVLVEIKNPETSYGKSGLRDSQKIFASRWRGSPIAVVRTEQEAVELVTATRRRER